MLALAIISTVLLSILILIFFGGMVLEDDKIVSGFIFVISLAFVIMSIWILYSR